MLSKWNGCRLLIEGKLVVLYTCQLRTVGEDLFQNVLSGMPQYCGDFEITLVLPYVDTVCCVVSCCSVSTTSVYCSTSDFGAPTKTGYLCQGLL
jgi:hypothetical protein